MIKSNILRTVISVLAVMILIGIALLIYTHFALDRDDVIRMDLEDEDGGTVQFEDLCLLPGESSEYTLLITNKLKNEFNTVIKFTEKEDGTLKNFAHVKIEKGDEVIYDELLSDAFSDDGITLPVKYGKKNSVKLKVTYYLPSEVGNEAENAEAVFELQVTAGKD